MGSPGLCQPLAGACVVPGMTMTFDTSGWRSAAGKALLGVICLASAPAPVCAQQAAAQTPNQAVAAPVLANDQDAQETRQQLQTLLSEHAPNVREVLQRDPALLGNTAYLAAYPRLAAFLSAHPEVVRSPAFFVGEPERHDRQDSFWMWREMLSMVAVGAVLVMFGVGFAWAVRTALDHRRWQRVSKVQVETHSKLLDRMTSSEDLRAYMASPAGRQFLESTPIALDGAAPLAAPVSRILWSMQVGVVALCAGLALQFVSRGVVDDAAQPLRVLGVLVTAIGAGFLISSGLAYALARRLGLLRTEHAATPSSSQA